MHSITKPPDLIELDFKVLHNVIFTNEKLFRFGKIDSPLCCVCQVEIETLQHIFCSYSLLQSFKSFLVKHIECLFKLCAPNVLNSVDINELLLIGFPTQVKRLNSFFLNLFLSVARYCIFKRRIMCNNGMNLPLQNFFRYSLKHYVSYCHYYFCKIKNNKTLFYKKIISYNSLVQETDDILIFKF